MSVSMWLYLSLCLSLLLSLGFLSDFLSKLQHLTVETMKIVILKYQDLVIIRVDFVLFCFVFKKSGKGGCFCFCLAPSKLSSLLDSIQSMTE